MTTSNDPQPCYVCGESARIFQTSKDFDFDLETVQCPVCGEYKIYRDLTHELDGLGDAGGFLSCATRQNWESAQSGLKLSRENAEELAKQHSRTSVKANLDKLVAFLGSKIKRPSGRHRFKTAVDYPVIDVDGQEEFREYLKWLADAKIIEVVSETQEGYVDVKLTIESWKRLEPSRDPGGKPGTCFVAMWFDDAETGAAYRDGIEPAVRSAGFTPIRIDEKEHNNQIADEIMAEIRGAQFTVADFTGDRAGVYYEAGFARGLGREVIYSCRNDWLGRCHFDTRGINHIVWTETAELKTKLENRIKVTIIGKR